MSRLKAAAGLSIHVIHHQGASFKAVKIQTFTIRLSLAWQESSVCPAFLHFIAKKWLLTGIFVNFRWLCYYHYL